jgi:hypothetical protein
MLTFHGDRRNLIVYNHMKRSSGRICAGISSLFLVVAIHLAAGVSADEVRRVELEKELVAVEEQAAEERIDVMAIDVIRQFGHEIRFDEPLVILSLGHSHDAAGNRHNYTFVKFGVALVGDGLFFDDLRYFALPKNARVAISDAGLKVSINGKPATAGKLPDSIREALVHGEGDRASIEDGLEVEVVSSIENGFSGERFGKGRWVGAFGIVPVRIWDGEVYLGRKHLGSVKELAKDNRIRLDPVAGTVAE